MSNIDQLADLIQGALLNYSEEITDGIKNLTDETMDKLVEDTRNDASELTGKYKKAITSKVTYNANGEYRKTWYVKSPQHGKAHLLNNGFAKKGGGRVAGDNHITNNERVATEQFENGVKEIIENVGR